MFLRINGSFGIKIIAWNCIVGRSLLTQKILIDRSARKLTVSLDCIWKCTDRGLRVEYCKSMYVVLIAVYIFTLNYELFLSCLFLREPEMGNRIYRELLVRYEQGITGPSHWRQTNPTNQCAAGQNFLFTHTLPV